MSCGPKPRNRAIIRSLLMAMASTACSSSPSEALPNGSPEAGGAVEVEAGEGGADVGEVEAGEGGADVGVDAGPDRDLGEASASSTSDANSDGGIVTTDSAAAAEASAPYCNVAGIPLACSPADAGPKTCGTGEILMTCCVGPVAPSCTPLFADASSSALGFCCPD